MPARSNLETEIKESSCEFRASQVNVISGKCFKNITRIKAMI